MAWLSSRYLRSTTAVTVGLGLVVIWPPQTPLVAAPASGARGADERACPQPELQVYKSRGELILTCAGKVRLRAPVTFGGNPIGPKTRSGDERTPEGRYTICEKHPSRRFYRFLGVSYPAVRDARDGLRRKLISPAQYRRIVAAERAGRCPPWNTPLGGAIGVHGVKSSHELAARAWTRISRVAHLHRYLGFTSGCIAVTNDVVDRLWRLVPPGTPLVVHPVDVPGPRSTGP